MGEKDCKKGKDKKSKGIDKIPVRVGKLKGELGCQLTGDYESLQAECTDYGELVLREFGDHQCGMDGSTGKLKDAYIAGECTQNGKWWYSYEWEGGCSEDVMPVCGEKGVRTYVKGNAGDEKEGIT